MVYAHEIEVRFCRRDDSDAGYIVFDKCRGLLVALGLGYECGGAFCHFATAEIGAPSHAVDEIPFKSHVPAVEYHLIGPDNAADAVFYFRARCVAESEGNRKKRIFSECGAV